MGVSFAGISMETLPFITCLIKIVMRRMTRDEGMSDRGIQDHQHQHHDMGNCFEEGLLEAFVIRIRQMKFLDF